MNPDKRSNQFFSQFRLRTYKKGEILIYPDSQPAFAFYIRNGFVRIYTISPQGVEVTLHIFSPYVCFPMMWIISDIPNHYYFEALTPLEVNCVPREKVVTYLKKEPVVLLDLTRRLLFALDKMSARIESLVFMPAYLRVISALLFTVRRFGNYLTDCDAVLKYKFTHRDIASLAGVSRETASRAIEELQRSGLIGKKQHMIEIKDVNKLETMIKNHSE